MKRPSADLATVGILHTIIAIGTLACGYYVYSYATRLPIIDEWGIIVEWATTPSFSSWVWYPHNDHRYPIARILWIAILASSDYRFDYPQYASVAFMSIAALFAAWSARCLRGRTRLIDAIPVALILHFGHGLSWLMGFQLASALSIASVAGWFLCAAKLQTGARMRWGYLSLLFMVLLVSCGGFGLAYGPAAVCWFAYLAIITRKSGESGHSRWFAIFAGISLIYFLGTLFTTTNQVREGYDPMTQTKDFLSVLVGFLTVGIGDWPRSSFGWTPGVASLTAGLVVLLIYVAGTLILLRKMGKNLWGSVFSLAALLCIVSTIAIAGAIARTRSDAILDRYTAFSSLGLIAIYLGCLTRSDRSISFGRRVATEIGGLLVAASVFLVNFTPGIEAGIRFRDSALPVIEDLDKSVPASILGARHGGTVSVRLGNDFTRILELLRDSKSVHIFTFEPDPVWKSIPVFPDVKKSYVWTVWADLPRPEPILLPSPPDKAFALQLCCSTESGVLGKIKLEWFNATTGSQGETYVQGCVTKQEMQHIFLIPQNVKNLRLIAIGDVHHAELKSFEWLVKPD